MSIGIARAGLVAAALVLAGCNGTFEDLAPKAEAKLPTEIVESMKAKGMTRDSPIMVRIFKEEGVLEVWKQKDTGRYDIIADYEICKWSGKLGPKFTEGDRQAPEGFYTVRPHQMNPQSSYHLSFNIGYPNAYDQANGRTGRHLMVHGACSSAGCYSMTDEQVEEIYAFARDAFRGGQTEFQVQAYPFRMTPQNMARYRNDPNFPFWKMLKEGYDHFEITKMPPKVDVCERRYVFNRLPVEGEEFEPTQACPATTQPDRLQMAYQSRKHVFDTAFSAAVSKGGIPRPGQSIAGLKEAALVADWSRRRARGEKVSREPPSLDGPETAVASAPAPTPAERAAETAEAKAKAIAEAEPEQSATETPQQAAVTAAVPDERPTGSVAQDTGKTAESGTATTESAPAEDASQTAFIEKLKPKRLWSMFGN